MVFYINKVKIKIEYSFLLIIAFALLLQNSVMLCVLLFSSLHELAHLISLVVFKGKPDELCLAFYGIGLKHSSKLSFSKELTFLLSGVAVNFLFAILNIQRDINYSLALINILPVYPLDGGRALKLVLNKLFSLSVSDKVFKTVSVVFSFLLIFGFIYYKNFSLLLIFVYLIIFSFNNSFE